MATLSPHIDQLPRIQVESRWDIEFLKTNLHNALIRSILEQTGCSSETDDKVKQMEHKMNKWIDNIFELASSSIEINGMPYEEAFKAIDEYEPFDEKLFQELGSLYSKLDSTLLNVIEKRKSFPEKIKMLVDDEMKRREESMMKQIFITPEEIKPRSASEEVKEGLESINIPELYEDYEKIFKYASDLTMSLSPLVEKFERAKTAIEDMSQTESLSTTTTNDNVTIIFPDNKLKNRSEDEINTPRRSRSAILKKLKATTQIRPY